MAQIVLAVIVLVLLGVFTLILYRRRKAERPDLEFYGRTTMDSLLEEVKIELSESTRVDHMIAINDINYEAVRRTKNRAEEALTLSEFNIASEVKIVTAMIRDVVARKLPDIKAICGVIDFTNLQGLEPMQKSVVLMYRLERQYKNQAINYLDNTYGISRLRVLNDNYTTRKRRVFDYQMLDNIFNAEIIPTPLTYPEMLDIMSRMLFAKYKGFECINDILQQEIDGIEFGVSGSIRWKVEGKFDETYKHTNSVWIQLHTNWIHISFLDFYNDETMKKVATQMVAWGGTKPMTEKNAIAFVENAAGNRITAIRPPAGECWASFIRVFRDNFYSMEQLLNKPGIKNWELPAKLIYFQMKAEATVAFTGIMSSGKTALMKAALEYVEDRNIRCLELAFELAYRELYKDKNVFHMKPTAYVSAEMLQDLSKKMDAYVNMIGEISDNLLATRFVQYSLVASVFQLMSHHGMDDSGLIEGLAHSMVATGEYKDHNVALSCVLDAVKHNVHMDFANGERVVSYISEIVKEEERQPYPELSTLIANARALVSKGAEPNAIAEAITAFSMLSREYMTRTTDRVKYYSRKIIVFNKETMSYEANEWYTPEMMERMLSRMQDPEDKVAFVKFYQEYWCKDSKEVA